MTVLVNALAGLLVLVVATAASMTGAAAHPHVFVDARAEILFDGQGRISAVRNIWKFDEAFSAFATQGLDKNHDGKLEASELAPLAKINVTSLKRYDFFTYVIAGSAKHPFLPPKKYHLEYAQSRLTLFFTLPLAEPVAIDRLANIEVFDPEYFVAFTFLKDPVSLDNAPAGCRASYEPPHMLSAKLMNALAAIPVAQHDLPPDLLNAAAALANVIHVDCPGSGPAAVAAAAPSPPAAAVSPGDAGTGSPPAAAAGAPEVRPAASVLIAPGAATAAGAAASANPAPAVPILHIRSEEEIDRTQQRAARSAWVTDSAMAAAAVMLIIAIAALGFFLQRTLRHSR